MAALKPVHLPRFSCYERTQQGFGASRMDSIPPYTAIFRVKVDFPVRAGGDRQFTTSPAWLSHLTLPPEPIRQLADDAEDLFGVSDIASNYFSDTFAFFGFQIFLQRH